MGLEWKADVRDTVGGNIQLLSKTFQPHAYVTLFGTCIPAPADLEINMNSVERMVDYLE